LKRLFEPVAILFNKDALPYYFWIIVIGFCLAYAKAQSNPYQKIEQLSAENERLRLFNAREVRRYKRPLASPRMDSIAKAEHILGVSGKAVEGVWKAENGPPDIETGVLGKTDYFSKNFPMTDWPALETGRTMNIYAWKWFTTTPEGKQALKQMLKYTAEPYTAMGKGSQQIWVKVVYSTAIEQDNGRKAKRKP
jgi:hypothetical protein